MELSIVTTLYRSEPFVEEFYRRAVAAAERLTADFEIIFVNDGSPDRGVDLAIELHRRDPRVVVVDLSRNFGHHKAMMTGLSHAKGEKVFLIDSDLEEPPEILSEFDERMAAEPDCDVVFGVQRSRRGGWMERFSGQVFYWLVDRLCDIRLPANLITARLMRRRYVRSLVRHREREIIIAGLWEITGYRQVAVEVDKKSSNKGSTYGFAKKLNILVNFVTSFSSNLLSMVMYLGFAISLTSFLFILFLVGRYFVADVEVEGWTSVIASVWLFGGLSILFIGLVGIYVSRIFVETKHRPYTIVRRLYRAAAR